MRLFCAIFGAALLSWQGFHFFLSLLHFSQLSFLTSNENASSYTKCTFFSLFRKSAPERIFYGSFQMTFTQSEQFVCIYSMRVLTSNHHTLHVN